jgi:hypothetical protein
LEPKTYSGSEVKFRFACFLVIYLGLVRAGSAVESSLPFVPGERLHYKIKWGLVPVGRAILEVAPSEEVNGTLCHKFVLSVRTNEFADAFYKVRTRAESYLAPDFSRSLLYQKKQQEGKTNRDVVVRFDYDHNSALYFNYGKLEREISIKPACFDPLSIAYLFRLGEIKTGIKRSFPTCDGRVLQDVLVAVQKKERLRVGAGKFEVFEATPALKNLRGVFKKSPRGILRIWYSADARRIPVKMSSKVAVGSFTARLEKIEIGHAKLD